MNYKDVAVYKEQQLNKENERLKTQLYNAIVLLQEKAFMDKDAIEFELNITSKEYNKIMSVEDL